jgi:RHS repeat-associated protein
VTKTTLGHVSDAWTYDGFGELETYKATSDGDTLYSMTGVARNKNGQITAMTELINGVTHTWSFKYDVLSRLTSATRSTTTGTTTNTYEYDVNGNRTSMNGDAYTYDAQDRLLTAPDNVSFTYTNNGTLLTQKDSEGTRTAVYDLSGVLGSMTLENNDVINYHNDGLQRRVGRDLTWGTPISQQFLYDDQLRIAAELNGSTVTSVFVYGTKPNVPDYMWQPATGKAYRILSDQLGSVRLVVTTTLPVTVIQQLDYDEFGNVMSSSFDTTCAAGAECFPFQPFGFAGGLQDRDTGMVRFGARDYLPSVGRWVSKDPIRFQGRQTNLYVYLGDDPINAIDNSGLDGWVPPLPGNGMSGGGGGYTPNPGAGEPCSYQPPISCIRDPNSQACRFDRCPKTTVDGCIAQADAQFRQCVSNGLANGLDFSSAVTKCTPARQTQTLMCLNLLCPP